MKHSWHWMRTLLTLTLVLTLCGLTPAAVPDVGYAESAAEGTTAAAAYGMATADDVIVRKQPSTSANYWFRINTGFVCEILDTVVRGDTTWYKVNSTHPTPNGRTYIGYVRASFFRPLTAEETEAYLASGRVNVTATPAPAQTPALTLQPSADDALVTATPASGSDFPFDTSIMGGTTSTPLVSMITPTPTTSQVTYGTGEITASGTNFRVAPSLSAGVIGKLNSGTVVTLLTIPDTIDENHWYQIRYNGQEGYIQSNFIRVLTAAVTATPQPSVYGTVKLLYDSANLRDAPNGTTRALWQGKGSTLSVAGVSQDKGGFTWYPVYYGTDNTVYYVRSDVVEYTAGSGVINTPTPTPGIRQRLRLRHHHGGRRQPAPERGRRSHRAGSAQCCADLHRRACPDLWQQLSVVLRPLQQSGGIHPRRFRARVRPERQSAGRSDRCAFRYSDPCGLFRLCQADENRCQPACFPRGQVAGTV